MYGTASCRDQEGWEEPLPPIEPEPDRRRAMRHRTVLRVAVMAPERGPRRFCLVRNISDGGAMIQADGAVAGEQTTIELSPETPIDGRVVWVREDYAGIQFARPKDWAGLLRADAASPVWRPRKPRIRVDRFATVRIGAELHWVGVRDISQSGAGLDAPLPATPGTRLVVCLDRYRPVEACLRWRGDEAGGLSFNEVLPLREVNDWLRQPA
jgi:hypothetical protein